VLFPCLALSPFALLIAQEVLFDRPVVDFRVEQGALNIAMTQLFADGRHRHSRL
jgi:hypothetical protein